MKSEFEKWGKILSEARGKELLDDVSNVVLHELVHRMTGAGHSNKAWAEECARIFALAKIRVRVDPWSNMTLVDGSRKGGCPKGSLDYEQLIRFPSPIRENMLDRIEGGAQWMDMPEEAISKLEVTERRAGRPKMAA